MFFSLQSPFRGQLALLWQLQSFFASVSDFCSCALLCESIVFLMFGRHLYDNFRVLWLNIVLSTWSSGKLLSIIFRNARPTLVFTVKYQAALASSTSKKHKQKMDTKQHLQKVDTHTS